MPTSLSEFIRENAERYAAERRRNKELIDEWSAAVAALFARLRGWITEADPTGLLEVNESTQIVDEPNLGRYAVPRIDIRGFGEWVAVVPKARKTVKSAQPPGAKAPERSTGRVDLTDGTLRYVLYRFTADGRDEWFIEGPGLAEMTPLTAERFGEALVNYLR